METIDAFLGCDKTACICSDWQALSTKRLYGKITYYVGDKIVQKQLRLFVPPDLDQFVGTMCALHAAAKRIALSAGASHGEVCFRSDGSDKSLNWRELFTDIRYSLTGRGAPMRRRLYFKFSPADSKETSTVA